MFFLSLSTDARIFTSFSHETSLWSGATWPTVFTWSREDYYRGIAANPPSSPPPSTVCPSYWFEHGYQTAAGRRQMSPGSHRHVCSTDLDDYAGGNREAALSTYLRSKWASSFCASSFRRRGWRREEQRGEQLQNTWAAPGNDKSGPFRLSPLCSAQQAPHLLPFRTMKPFIYTLDIPDGAKKPFFLNTH